MFLSVTGAAVVAQPGSAEDGQESRRKRRVGVIGHTGRGDYGHGLDTVWLRFPEAGIVGVADADDAGMRKAMRRLKTARGFRDYRRLLTEGKPEFVSICPRYADQHAEMMVACAEEHTVVATEGGGVYTFGHGEEGQLGHGDEEDQLAPRRVPAAGFNGERVVMVAAGGGHTVALSEAGHVFTWGYGRNGQLGHGDQEDQRQPRAHLAEPAVPPSRGSNAGL